MPIADLPPSDFTSGDPYRARWDYRELPVINVCATQGAGLLHRLQDALRLAPAPAWNADLQQALINRAVELSATQPGWDGVISRLRSDLASAAPGTVVGPLSHQFGIYVAYYLPNNRRFDAISLPANVTLLRWDTPPADDGGLNGGAVVCVDPDRDSPFLNVTAATVAESATGIRVGPDRPMPPDQVTRPNAAVIGGGAFVAIVAVGAGLWWWFTRSSERKNPTVGFEGKSIRIEPTESSPRSWNVFVNERHAGSVRIVKGKPQVTPRYETYAGATQAQHDAAREAVDTLYRFADTAWPTDLKTNRMNPSPLKVTEINAETVVKTMRGTDKEFEVRIYESGKLREAATYFTMDKDDALGTHDAMVAQIRRRANPYARSWHDAILRSRANPGMSAAQLEEWRACRARAMACEERILRGSKPVD